MILGGIKYYDTKIQPFLKNEKFPNDIILTKIPNLLIKLKQLITHHGFRLLGKARIGLYLEWF
jgi:hypothetical protein